MQVEALERSTLAFAQVAATLKAAGNEDVEIATPEQTRAAFDTELTQPPDLNDKRHLLRELGVA